MAGEQGGLKKREGMWKWNNGRGKEINGRDGGGEKNATHKKKGWELSALGKAGDGELVSGTVNSASVTAHDQIKPHLNPQNLSFQKRKGLP